MASARKEDNNTTDQSDQLMSRFSDIFCSSYFLPRCPLPFAPSSFLLLGFWSERRPRSPSVYLYPTLAGSSSRAVARIHVHSPLPHHSEFKGPESAHNGRAPRRRWRIHARLGLTSFLYISKWILTIYRASSCASRA